MKYRSLFLVLCASVLLLFTCADPIDRDLIQVAEDVFPPELVDISPADNSLYYSTVNVEGLIADNSLIAGDGEGRLVSFQYSLSNDRNRKGKIYIDENGHISIDTVLGSGGIVYNPDTGEFSFSFSTLEYESGGQIFQSIITGTMTIDIILVDANDNSITYQLTLRQNDKAYLNLQEPGNYINNYIPGDPVEVYGNAANSSSDLDSNDELVALEFSIPYLPNHNLSIDLTSPPNAGDHYEINWVDMGYDSDTQADIGNPVFYFYPEGVTGSSYSGSPTQPGYFYCQFLVPDDQDGTLDIKLNLVDKKNEILGGVLAKAASLYSQKLSPIVSGKYFSGPGIYENPSGYYLFSSASVGDGDIVINATVNENGSPVHPVDYTINSSTDGDSEVSHTGISITPPDLAITADVNGLLTFQPGSTAEFRLVISNDNGVSYPYLYLYDDPEAPVITINSGNFRSSNSNSSYAALGNNIILNFNVVDVGGDVYASGLSSDPVITIAGHTLAPVSLGSGNWQAVYTMADGDITFNESQVPYSITISDNLNNQIVADESTYSGTDIIYYQGAPVVTNVSWSVELPKDGLDPKRIKVGDTVRLNFETARDLSTTSVTINGNSITPIKSGSLYTAEYTLQSSDSETGSFIPYSISITDMAGNVSTLIDDVTDLMFDKTSPSQPGKPDLTAGSDTGISQTDNYTNSTNPLFTGTVDAGDYVTLYDGVTEIDTVLTSDGSWGIDGGSLSAGEHTMTVKAVDGAGNESSSSSGLTVTFDRTVSAPTEPDLIEASDSGSSNSDNFTSNTTPSFIGTAESGSAVTLYRNGSVAIGNITATDGNWSIESDVLNSGTYEITAVAVDIAGNTSSASSGLTVSIDGVSPSVSTVSPVSETPNLSGNTTFTIIFNEDLGTATGSETLGSTIFDSSNSTMTIAGDTVTISPNFILSSGNYTGLSVTGFTDLAGNAMNSYSNVTYSIDIDGDKPTVTGESPSNGDEDLSPSTNLVINFSETLNAAPGTILWGGVSYVDGSNATITISGSEVTLDPDIDLSGGSHSGLTVSGFSDAAGNVMNSYSPASYYIIVDATPPAKPDAPDLDASSDTNIGDDNITSDSTPTFIGTAEDNSTVTLYKDGIVIGSETASTGGGSWSITPASISDGTYDFTVTAQDGAGNTSPVSAALEVTIDSVIEVPMTPDLDEGSDSGSLGSDNITNLVDLSFHGIAERGAVVTLYEGGTNSIGSAPASSTDGSWIIAASTLSASSHSITVVAEDTAGNVSSSSADLSITIDQTKPSIDSYSPTDGVSDIPGTANIILTFNEILGTTKGTVTLDGTTYEDGVNCSISISGSQATINPDSDFTTGSYTGISVSGFTDLAGNIMSTITNAGYTFTVDADPPVVPDVSSISPADNSMGIAADTNIVIIMSENLGTDLGTVMLDTITFNNGTNCSISITDKQITVNPVDPFIAGTTYTKINISGFSDLAGNVMVSTDFNSYSFTIAGP